MVVSPLSSASLQSAVSAALTARAPLLSTWHDEGTDAYRLFHGAVEGAPGCTLDRYGDLLLWQTFREPPDVPPDELLPMLQDMVETTLGVSGLSPHWSDRRRRAATTSAMPPPAMLQHP